MGNVPNVQIAPAALHEKIVLRHLLELYKHDFSEFTGEDVDANSLFGYRYLDHYWTEPRRWPFLFRVDRRLAGFALVTTGLCWRRTPAAATCPSFSCEISTRLPTASTLVAASLRLGHCP